jgi:ABC-type dipeptide/oligopeptide/nickel transport system permease subunit
MTPVKHSDLLGSGAGLASAIAVETHGELGEIEAVKARGYWEQVWLRFKRDRVAIAGGVFVVSLILFAFVGAPLAENRLGHGPNDINSYGGLDKQSQLPVGPWTEVSTEPYPGAPGKFDDTLYILGADSQLGRDMFLRLLYGAQTSLEVAILATLLSVSNGLVMGLIAGYYRGWVDTLVSRLTEIVMAFPYLLFVIAIAATVGERLNKITFGGLLHPGVFTLVMIFGIFGWFYPARIIRSQILSLREKEFVEAARMTGASDWRIMRSHLLPHLVAPLIVYSTLIVANNVIGEAGLSFLGLGIPAPTASWGNLLAEGPNYYLTQPWLMVWPGLAILLTTLSFNLLGDGLRDAFDPRAAR